MLSNNQEACMYVLQNGNDNLQRTRRMYKTCQTKETYVLFPLAQKAMYSIRLEESSFRRVTATLALVVCTISLRFFQFRSTQESNMPLSLGSSPACADAPMQKFQSQTYSRLVLRVSLSLHRISDVSKVEQ